MAVDPVSRLRIESAGSAPWRVLTGPVRRRRLFPMLDSRLDHSREACTTVLVRISQRDGRQRCSKPNKVRFGHHRMTAYRKYACRRSGDHRFVRNFVHVHKG